MGQPFNGFAAAVHPPLALVASALGRGRAYAPHADLLWMETAKPNIPEARAFAEGVHAAVPHQKLAYNLSPSFNWDAAGMSKQKMASFNRELGRLGFVWQVSGLCWMNDGPFGLRTGAWLGRYCFSAESRYPPPPSSMQYSSEAVSCGSDGGIGLLLEAET